MGTRVLSDVCCALRSRKTLMVIFLGICTLVILSHSPEHNVIKCVQQNVQQEVRHVDICARGEDDLQRLILQRNHLAGLLNDITQKHAQLNCQTKGQLRLTAAQMRWCEGTDEFDSSSHVTDPKLALKLAEFFANRTVASFGDGPGLYKKYITESGKVYSYEAFDDAPYSQTLSGKGVKYIKMTIPQYGLGLYDWVLCLDVADTIPRKYENVFADNLVRHAREGIVVSWLTPRQSSGSRASVNKRNFLYVKSIFAKYGFVHDAQSSNILQSSAALPWLRVSTYVFKRLPSTLPCLLDI